MPNRQEALTRERIRPSLMRRVGETYVFVRECVSALRGIAFSMWGLYECVCVCVCVCFSHKIHPSSMQCQLIRWQAKKKSGLPPASVDTAIRDHLSTAQSNPPSPPPSTTQQDQKRRRGREKKCIAAAPQSVGDGGGEGSFLQMII